jgi:hypothetical protein
MARQQDKRVWLGGGAFAAVFIIALSWFVFIGPELSSTDDLHQQAANTTAQNATLQSRVAALKVKSQQLPKYTAALKTALSALPFDSGLPAFTRQLAAQAHAHHVGITSIVVGGVSAVSATDTTSPTPATPTTTTAAGGLFAVQVTVVSNGALADQLDFLDDVRSAGPRRALVSSTQLTPGGGKQAGSIDSSVNVTTQLKIFSAPQSPAQIAVLQKMLSGKAGN